MIEHGNANQAGGGRRGWFTGPFLPPDAGPRHAPVSLKWSHLQAGWRRGWSPPAQQTTLALLTGPGQVVFQFDDGTTTALDKPGDYVLWTPGLTHDVTATTDATLLTIRW